MIEWIWRQIGLHLPPDWELLQFAREAKRGRCAFADRHRFRCELNWHAFASEPDFDRMMSDYAATLDATWHDITSVRAGGWPGLTGTRQDEAVSRFGRYFPVLGLLVELVIIHHQHRDADLEEQILASVRPVPADPRGFQRWRAFGMDFTVPAHFQFAECQVQPARVGLMFKTDKKGPDCWIFRRYGMVSAWMNESLRVWLDRQTDGFVRHRRLESGSQGNLSIERVFGQWIPKGILLPRGDYAASAWIDPGDQRLYHVLCITGKKNLPFHPGERAEQTLRSCPEFLVVPKPSGKP